MCATPGSSPIFSIKLASIADDVLARVLIELQLALAVADRALCGLAGKTEAAKRANKDRSDDPDRKEAVRSVVAIGPLCLLRVPLVIELGGVAHHAIVPNRHQAHSLAPATFH